MFVVDLDGQLGQWSPRRQSQVPTVSSTRSTMWDSERSRQPWDSVWNHVPDHVSGHRAPRVADDVVLTNVIGFDVKAWEPAELTERGEQ